VEIIVEKSDYEKARERLYMRGNRESVSSYLRSKLMELVEDMP
jgi:hypothetical protein